MGHGTGFHITCTQMHYWADTGPGTRLHAVFFMWTGDMWQPNCSNGDSNIKGVACVRHIINNMYYSMGCVLGINLDCFPQKEAISSRHVINFRTGRLLYPHIFSVALTGTPLRLPTVVTFEWRFQIYFRPMACYPRIIFIMPYRSIIF